MTILLVVRARAVAILEVDPVVLHRLGTQLLDHLLADCRGTSGRLLLVSVEAQSFGKGLLVGGVFLEHRQRGGAKLLSRTGAEKVCSAVDRMHRLPGGRLSGIGPGQRIVLAAQVLQDRPEIPVGQRERAAA